MVADNSKDGPDLTMGMRDGMDDRGQSGPGG